MTRLEKDKINCTSVIIDIRNFSETFKIFQNNNDPSFLEFTEKFYSVQNSLARVVSNDIYISSTGDGVLTIFLGEGNHKDAYAYILSTHKVLTKMCYDFINSHKGVDISFGLGADSGNVWSAGKGSLKTYVGTVINRASRIESMTKMFGGTTSSIGNSLYRKLLKEFYPSSFELMSDYSDYRELLNKNPEVVLISKQLLLQYVFEMVLKGIQENAPLFRIDELLVEDIDLFDSVMNKLIDVKKINKIEKIFKKMLDKFKFELIKDFEEYKKGEIFESFGGFCYGIASDITKVKINFNNKEYFKLISN